MAIQQALPPTLTVRIREEAAFRSDARLSDPVSDDRTCSGRGYNDSDIDLIGGDGQQSSSNKDRLSGKSTSALSSAMTTEMIQGPWTWIKRIRELEKEAMYIL